MEQTTIYIFYSQGWAQGVEYMCMKLRKSSQKLIA